MKAKRPEYQLCAPWYAPGARTPGSKDAHRPVLQKYADLDWVPGLLADPTSSVAFDDGDVRTYPVTEAGTPQRALTEHRVLFQPVKSLAYAVLIELCLTGPQFAPAGVARDVAVRFVVRRERVPMPLPGSPPPPGQPDPYRDLARKILRPWNPGHEARADLVTDPDLQDLLSAPAFVPAAFEHDYHALRRSLHAGREAQALTGGPDGPWTWTPIVVSADGFALIENEREYPMWRVLPAADATGDDKQRSLWFGAVPTDGPVLPPGPADFRTADYRWTYTLACVAHQAPPPDMPDCPPRTLFSAPSPGYRPAQPT